MKKVYIFSFWVVLFLAVSAAAGERLDALLASYDAVERLSCELRRDTPLPDGGNLRMLSRIYFQRQDRLHVENFSPIKRRIIADGTVFRSYMEGADKGFSRPIAELDHEMLVNLRMLPGSNANILQQLAGLAEMPLEGTAEYPERFGYDHDGQSFTVLSFDGLGRWAKMEVYASQNMTDVNASSEYSDFKELIPGTWLACRQKSTVNLGGIQKTEIVHISNIAVNQPIPAAMFDATPFFKGVEFVDAFEKISMK